ncbi:hypothetical protein ACSNOB_02620 [Micromonospora sp. URMC 106]|uniref:hypothetical protein n=1 Tax=Micromonospora sp. URMC 106 TaxID=3423408 RepID=UPI003F1CBD17
MPGGEGIQVDPGGLTRHAVRLDRRTDSLDTSRQAGQHVRFGRRRVGAKGDAGEVPLGALREAVAALRRVPGEPAELAAHLAARYPAVVAAADAARACAEGFLRQRDTGWRLAADELRGWVDAVAGLPEREATLARLKAGRAWLKAGRAWLKAIAVQLRNERWRRSRSTRSGSGRSCGRRATSSWAR